MWKKPDFILIAAVSGIVGASLIGSGYILYIAALSSKHGDPTPPASHAAELVPNSGAAAGQSLTEASAATPSSLQDDDVPATDAAVEPIPALPAPQPIPFVDHRYDGVITPEAVSQIKAPLHLSPDQDAKWRALATALRQAGAQQKARIDGGQRLSPSFNQEVLAKLIPPAMPLVQSLRDDQVKGAGRLARALGFKTASAMVEAASATTRPVEEKAIEPRVAVTPALPPVAKAPVLSAGRYDGLLTPAEINRIKLSLKLRSDQEPYWPPVAAILRELGQQQMAQVDSGQKLEVSMSGDLAQRFYFAASPLLQTLTEEQKSEVRRRARMMGLEAYASYL